MKKHERSRDDFVSPESSDIVNSQKQHSRFAGMIDQAHSINTLHLMSAFCQVFLSVAVILLSATGFIKPFWLATILSMFGSVATMLGIYFLYTVVFWKRDSNRLLREAMRRIMDAKN